MALPQNIIPIGVNDYDIDLFEGQYPVPEGMTYNSYVILDKKIAVMDTVDAHFGQAWLANLNAALAGKVPDYLIVQHMEPDHSANIELFMETFPQAIIVSSAKAFAMMEAYFGTDYAERRMVVGEGDTLSLGAHELAFVAAPMVHWPEVIMTYDANAKVLFSADAFGKFGAVAALDGEKASAAQEEAAGDVAQEGVVGEAAQADQSEAAQGEAAHDGVPSSEDDDWACEARRYYFGIVGKFGKQVQAVLKKAAGLDIETICPLHGPVLTESLGYYLDLYNTWSSYEPEDKGITIAYCSVYGHTKQAALELARKLEAAGAPSVSVFDLARCDMAEAVEDAFRYDKLVLVSTTYNGDMFPFMKDFIHHLLDHAYQNRTIALMESGSWAPAAARAMRAAFEGCKNITFAENVVTVRGALSADAEAQMDALVAELTA